MNPIDLPYREWEKVAQTYNRENLQEVYESYLKIFAGHPVPIIWKPDNKTINNSNIKKSLDKLNFPDYQAFFNWAANNRAAYWRYVAETLDISFAKPYEEVLDLKNGVENPSWFRGALLNIVESCFRADPHQPALIEGSEGTSTLVKTTYKDLREKVEKVAGGLKGLGYKPGDAIVIYAPFSSEAIICYLALIKIGLVAVSVADSFSSEELKKRIEISQAKAVITTSSYLYGGKELKIYEKVQKATELPAIVFGKETELRASDLSYQKLFDAPPFLGYRHTDPDSPINILFSSGTTKEPKAIPFTHLTPLKCAADAHFHQDFQAADVVTWTTGMGWMMAPWLIFAGLVNKASLAVYVGSPSTDRYGEFVEKSQITIMGTIPSVVRAWKRLEFHKKVNWKVRLFTSTGEPSNPQDYFYLMALSGFKAPLIEYCGGTELGGGYIASTPVHPVSPSLFTTPTLGLDFHLLQPDGGLANNKMAGEVYLVPVSVGMSQKLLNRDHHKEYYEGVPKGPKGETLRRHGDAFEQITFEGVNFYRSVGRTDDVMNLGGIKVSAVELEEVLNAHPSLFETAAVSTITEDGGLERLLVFVVPRKEIEDPEVLKVELQELLNARLNPLFKISEIKLVEKLPRTTSNKLMRRELRKSIQLNHAK